jgi:DnaJ-class molecular chaperone
MLFRQQKETIIICPTCEGNGIINTGNLREMHNHDSQCCPDCNGNRIVQKIKTVEFRKIIF